MKIQGVIMNQQNIVFSIVIVQMYLINSPARENFRRSLVKVFGTIPIILMAQDSQGTVTFQGRKDIVSFLVDFDISSIAWKEYTLI